jgi:hypothetical protein
MSNAGIAQKSHKPASPWASLEWQEYANCRGHEEPNIFHDRTRCKEALAVCEGCPVMLQCKRHGVGQGDGVYGGQWQSGRIRQPDCRKPPTDDPRCGSVAGHSAHRRRDERPCDACREANNISSHGRRPKK